MSADAAVWVRYSWDLENLRVNIQAPVGYHFRSALSVEVESVTQVVLSAYRSDPVWELLMAGIEERMRERIKTTLGTQGTDYLLAEYESSIVAVSGIAKSHWTDQNLLTGICVLPEHQRKGLGKYLLGLSLL